MGWGPDQLAGFCTICCPAAPGIDAGFDVLITEDVDGQVRPQGAGFDIGFDEGGPRTAVLPVVLR